MTVDLELLNLHIREFGGPNISLGICLLSDGYRGLPQPSGKCGRETQSSLTLHPSIMCTINCSLSPWHFPGRLNQSHHSDYSNSFFNSRRQHLTHHNAAIYILYGERIQISVSIYRVRGDLYQMKCVKFIVSDKLYTEYKLL